MFDWSKMPPVSLPFAVPSLFELSGTKKNAEEDGAQESELPFPFSLMKDLPRMPFPFPMSGEEDEGQSETFGGLPLSFLFPFYQMVQMMKFFQSLVPTQDDKDSAGEPDGFSPFGFPIPPAVLQRLLQMDASPKTLEQLQRVLDFVFDAAGSDK